MKEYSNRVDAHRKVIKMVNSVSWRNEPLFSLSIKAIERWCFSNHLTKSDNLPSHLILISSKLFFLANKSQEQITEEYCVLQNEVDEMIDILSNMLHENHSVSF